MGTIRRVNPEAFRKMVEGLSDEELQKQNQRDTALHEKQLAEFKSGYRRGICYLCGKPFKTQSVETPCIHWLLRECKFKKKDFPQVFLKHGYSQISSYLRWCANQVQFQSCINDMIDPEDARTVFSYTVVWKRIEWTFECSRNDLEGHSGTRSDFPHYHFQMRMGGKPFIDFSDFHIPFTEDDLFILDLKHQLPTHFHHSFGIGGSGMSDALDISPDEIINKSEVAKDDESATYRLQTMLNLKDQSISGETLLALYKISKDTGRTMASLLREHLPESASIKTIVSPADTVPEIARRTERNRR